MARGDGWRLFPHKNLGKSVEIWMIISKKMWNIYEKY